MKSARTFARGAALSAFSTGVALASLLAIGKMAAVALQPEHVAFFMLTLLAADAMNLFSNFGLFASVPKLVAEQHGPQERGQLLASILAGQGCASLLAGFGMVVAAGMWADQRELLLIAAPLAVLGACRDTLLSALAGMQRYGAHTLASVVLSGGQALAVYLLFWRTTPALGQLFTAVLLAQVMGTGLLLALVGVQLRATFSMQAYFSSVRFSIPLWINTLLNFSFQRIDTLLITMALGMHLTAVYEIAKRFPQTLSRVLNALLLPWLPTVTRLVSEGRMADADRAIGLVLCVVTWLGYGGILLAVALSGPLVLLLATPDYLQAAAVLGWLMTGIHFAVQAGIFGQTLIALGKPGAVTRANIVQAGVSLLLTWLLLSRFGLLAPGYAWCAAAGLSLLMQLVAVRRALKPEGDGSWLLSWGWMHACFAVAALASAMAPGVMMDMAVVAIFGVVGGLPLVKAVPMLRQAKAG